MEESDEVTIRAILLVISRLTDPELIQLKCAVRKEMERRNLKLSRHNTNTPANLGRI